jgi:hypothetical protein
LATNEPMHEWEQVFHSSAETTWRTTVPGSWQYWHVPNTAGSMSQLVQVMTFVPGPEDEDDNDEEEEDGDEEDDDE